MGKITELELPTSGVRLKIRRISPILLNDIRRHLRGLYPVPRPPMVKVKIGEDEKLEPNPADPDYLSMVEERNIAFSSAFLESLVHFGVEVEPDMAEVAALRELSAGIDLPLDDKVLYVTRIALSSPTDMDVLQAAILGRAQPTEAAVADAAAQFPGAVPGA